MSTKHARRLLWAAGVGAGLAGLGCTATVHTFPVTTSAYVEAGPPVAEVRSAPAVIYEGHPVYWYGGRWYFRSGNGWHFYEHEPAELRGRRYYVRYR